MKTRASRKVARWRAEQQLTTRAAAELIGVSAPTVLAVEKGSVSRIGLEVAAAFVRACDGAGLTLEDFISRTRRNAA